MLYYNYRLIVFCLLFFPGAGVSLSTHSRFSCYNKNKKECQQWILTQLCN